MIYIIIEYYQYVLLNYVAGLQYIDEYAKLSEDSSDEVCKY